MKKFNIFSLLLVQFALLHFNANAQNILYLIDEKTEEGIPDASLNDPFNEINYVSGANGEVFLDAQTTFLASSHVAYKDTLFSVKLSFPIYLKLIKKETALKEILIFKDIDRPHQTFPFNQVSLSKKDYFIGERSLSPVISSTSGVLLEERASGSYRVSIRGSSLRSPYGVRNVKIYYYGFPYSSAFGLSDLNSLDVSHIDNIEIRKGPMGSIYGAGNGGVLFLNNLVSPTNNYSSIYGGIGSFGQNKFQLRSHINVKNGSINLLFSQSGTQGYRTQNELNRQNIQYYQTFQKKNHTLNFLLLGSNLYYQIPGGLTSEQLKEDPKQARPRSEEQQSSIFQKKIIGGVAHSVELKNNALLSSQLSLQFKDFKNPFILDYKEEKEIDFTFRSVYQKKWTPLKRPLTANIGLELLSTNSQAKNNENNQGQISNIRFQDNLKAFNLLFFQQLDLDLSSKLNVVFGISQNLIQYNINRTLDSVNMQVGQHRIQQNIELIPRLSINYHFSPAWFLFHSISKGFSPPAINEIRTNDGSINESLNAESIWSYEIGTRYSSPKPLFKMDLSLFFAKLNNAITTYTNPEGVSLFQNSGNVIQRGFEADILLTPVSNSKGIVSDLSISSSYTGHFFRFKNFTDSNKLLNNNKYTGVAPHILVNQMNLGFKKGIYFRVSHRYNSALPLDNENQVFQEPFNVLRIGMGWKKELSAKVSVDLYCIVDNLLNETYSLGNDLNAFSNRYYQPAPGRNWLSGITLSFKPMPK